MMNMSNSNDDHPGNFIHDYLGEIIQWVGWAILTRSWAGSSFALFTFCNLAPRAVANHRWYRKTFADYPAERKILLPGLF